MVVCLDRGADLHTAQLLPLPLASVKSRLVLPFWYHLLFGSNVSPRRWIWFTFCFTVDNLTAFVIST